MEQRNKNAVVTLAVGLTLNILLGVSKLAAGILSRSASVTSDSLNNLSDAAVSVVTIIATALSVRRADHDHPFGHGRYEYIATFVVGAAILAVGAEVFISGIERIVEPVTVEIGLLVWITLGGSIAVKSFMAAFYSVRARGVTTGADTLKAAAIDSISDAGVTAVVLCCMIAELYTGAHIDGYASIAVAVVIVVFAVKILKTTISRLLGERPDPVLYDAVSDMILSHDKVSSVHDIIINDYGAATKIAEADAEFPSELSFVEVHSICDEIEREVYEKTGIRLSIHADPVISNDERLDEIKKLVAEILGAYNATAHDIVINDCKKHVDLDVRLSDSRAPVNEITEQIKARINTLLSYSANVNIDYI